MATQRLTVPVDVPAMSVVHLACVQLLDGDRAPSRQRVHGGQGCPIAAEVRIEHTRQWSDEGDDEALDFGYEVEASPENWLVGGQCSARFRAKVSLAPPCCTYRAHPSDRKVKGILSRSCSCRRGPDISSYRPSAFGQSRPGERVTRAVMEGRRPNRPSAVRPNAPARRSPFLSYPISPAPASA